MCAKFHFNCIYLKHSMEEGPFCPLLALERPKKPSINRVNPQNKDDVYCFMYAITIALFNKEFGKNPVRVSQNLRLHSDILVGMV